MPKTFCIWGAAEGPEKYAQLIADGWTPLHSGEITVVLTRENNPCTLVDEVHTTTE